ncbi:MAG TPA: dihydrolipoamide acetyltransferase family protein [Thermoanaerobaculia bacterium]|nr:dihydrolipoamide acetyltransferase family protein [Thermoanaerobaculia bacterium]
MAEIIMPKMGDAMTEGKVVRWYKENGDSVKKGEPLLEIETDKVNLDLEAEQDGVLSEIAASDGDVVPVGGRLAVILGAGESAPAAATKPKAVVVAAASKAEAPQALNIIAMPYLGGSRLRSSPLARKMANELGVSLEAVHGSGPNGRIIANDVKQIAGRPAAAASATPASAPTLAPAPELEEVQIPHSAMRRTIAKRLAESTGPIPHFYLTAGYDVTSLVSLRQQLADIEGSKISLNDFIIRAVALALRHHPNVNASWGDETITRHGEIHVGVAVSTPEGLITPVIRNADRKSVPEIAREVRAFAEKAKNRKLMPAEYQGSTFTISNLGAWGIEEFTAIINPPNSAILAIGAAGPQPVVIAGQVVVRERMKVTMSCDHRVIDGAAGAEYLKTLRQYMEQPLRLVV